MEPARLPADEAARLALLHGLRILDTEPEPAFDALARLAMQHTSCPIGLVSLIDDRRQWFKAAAGLDGVRETPRDVSFCAHAILEDETFVVEDAAHDARFADNPLVAGAPGIRFYAGAPLQVGGRRLGTLCVIDRVPRYLAPDQHALLRELAQVTSGLLEARLREQRLRALLPPAPGAGIDRRVGLGVFDAVSARMAVLDRQGRILETNAAWQRFASGVGSGAGKAAFVGAAYLEVLGRTGDLNAESAEAARLGIESVIDGRAQGFEFEYRCIPTAGDGDPHGEGDGGPREHWFSMRVVPVGGENRRLVVSHEDITHHKRAQEALLRLAHTDALTGVANRRRFLELGQHELERAIRYKTRLTVLMADIDHFKAINDQHGHAGGDHVLRAFVQTAGESLRDADLIGRLGGEEFAVLLPQTGPEGGHALAERIVEHVAASRVVARGAAIAYTVSIGVSTLGPRITSFDDLLRAADDELYRAKDAGRNTVSSAFGPLE